MLADAGGVMNVVIDVMMVAASVLQGAKVVQTEVAAPHRRAKAV